MTSGTFTKILKERQRQQRRRKLIAAGVVAVVVALVGFAIYAFYFSSWLVVKAVEVSGHELLTEGEVLQAAAVELERPLISTDVTSIAARVSALKPVADVKVSRSYPDRVVIEITEREALYQLATDTSFEWVDETGTIFHSTPEATEDLIRVRITAEDERERLLRDVATVVYWFPIDMKSQVTSVQAEAVDAITISLTDDRTVLWGSAEESELKSEVLGTLLQMEARVYDVSAPLYPTTR